MIISSQKCSYFWIYRLSRIPHHTVVPLSYCHPDSYTYCILQTTMTLVLCTYHNPQDGIHRRQNCPCSHLSSLELSPCSFSEYEDSWPISTDDSIVRLHQYLVHWHSIRFFFNSSFIFCVMTASNSHFPLPENAFLKTCLLNRNVLETS